MKSRANIKSHPLHPILVCFPIAFFTGTLIFDVLAFFSKDLAYQNTAELLGYAGIFGALAAAIPGIIDFRYTVPPDSSAKKRAAKHGTMNVCVLLLFVLVCFLRGKAPQWSVLTIEVLAFVLMSFAGWMGGTLVHRNQIGVDIRYSNAGKWKEEYFKEGAGEIEIKADDLQIDQMKLLHIGDKRIVIARSSNGLVAFDDRCTHRGGSLAAGSMICGTVQCPWHGSQFSVSDGSVKAGPAKTPIKTYSLRVESGKTFLSPL
jgi:uncharacterized membrane protein/nitrite reductase/ring-hydroxylating ferredoxin subunit